MILNIFGREVVFQVKKQNDSEKKIERTKNIFSYRFLIAMIIFFVFGSIIELQNLSINYEIGNVAQQDIIAYKDLVYTVDILDENIKSKIIKKTTPEFDELLEIPGQSTNQINDFFKNIKSINLTDDTEVMKFIKEHNYNLTIKDVNEIAKRESIDYAVKLITAITKVYEVGIVKQEDFEKILSDKKINLDNLDIKFLKNFIRPNLVINEQKTLEKIGENIDSLKNKQIKIYKGDIIVKKGKIIDGDAFEKMEKLNLVRGKDRVKKISGLLIVFSLIVVIFYYSMKKYCKDIIESKAFFPSMLTIIFVNIFYVIIFNDVVLVNYILPFALIPIMLTILGNKIFAISFSFFNMLIFSRDENWFLITLLISLIAIYRADKIKNRSEVVKIGIFLGIMQSLVSLGYGLINQYDYTEILIIIVFSVISGIITGMLALGILPYFENMFDILTDIKLLELSDFSHPLLKKMLVIAPGTFHHSIMVGALAESGAEAIGANAIFTRVASYYHDIGKMKRPLFFVENQKGVKNTHDKLKPSLSALIIISHTKDGYIMGKQNKLPKEILDVILSHHGTTLVQFFYYKALNSGEKVVENDFRYSGPKPRTKEESIILLADTIEAAVRVSEDKSREGLENLIRYLIKYKIDDMQLSESELTLNEIEKVIQAFLNTLQGMYHERIKYPKLEEKDRK